MKNVLFLAMISLFIVSCEDDDKHDDDAASKSTEMNGLYEKNLATVKTMIAAFEKEDLDAFGSNIADTVKWGSPAYGDTITTKAHWMESLKFFTDNWNDFHLMEPVFLPGIDQKSHEMDGSVRFYGRWDGVHSSGVATKVNFYGTYDFNADGKIVTGDEFFDLGGMLNAVKPMAK